MKIEDVMKRFPATLQADDDLTLARDYMVWMGIRHLPVISGGKLVGLVSERDLLAFQARVDEGTRGGFRHRAEEAMQSPVQTANPEDSLTEATARMAEYKIDCLPVTERGELVGIVTVTDILRAQVHQALAPSPGQGPMAPGTGPTVREAMTPAPQSVHPDDRLLDAAARMQSFGIRHLPVTDGACNVLGMLSDRDVRNAVGDPRRVLDYASAPVQLDQLRVSEVMSTPAITVRADESCMDIARYFADLAVGAAPVVDQDGKLVGIISYIDILRVLAGTAERAEPGPGPATSGDS